MKFIKFCMGTLYLLTALDAMTSKDSHAAEHIAGISMIVAATVYVFFFA